MVLRVGAPCWLGDRTLLTKMKEVIVFFIVGFLLTYVHSFDRSRPKYACEGRLLNLDCPRLKTLQILSANFGRTSKALCTVKNQNISDINCISKSAKNIIYRECDRKQFCTVMANSSNLGGDPCPGVFKYIDVIYKCVRTGTDRVMPTRRSAKNITAVLPTTHQEGTTFLTSDLYISTIFDGNIIKPRETNIQENKKQSKHGFFHSVLVLLVLLKDKPKHSLLSVLTGVAAGAVIVLVTVLVCVCVDKRRQKNESACFNDSGAKKSEHVELEKSELLGKKKGSNSDSARTDDQVDSAFSDDEPDRRVSNDYESASDMAYLDSYLDEYNKDRSLPRPPAAGNDHQRRMSRRAHNDGSKGRSYDYNENSFTTFS